MYILRNLYVRRAAAPIIAGAFILVLLSGCARLTTVETEGRTGPYAVGIKLDPFTINPPQLGTMTYSFTDTRNNKPIIAFEPVSGALLHNVLISRDLQHFWHSYAKSLVTEQASVSANFPALSRYYAYAEIKPEDEENQVFTSTITMGDVEGAEASLAEEPSPVKTQGWLSFQLVKGPEPVESGRPTQLVFHITERGRSVAALWPLLDAAGHLWVVDEQGGSFAHLLGASEYRVSTPSPATPGTGTATPGEDAESDVAHILAVPTFVPEVRKALATVTSAQPEQMRPVQETALSSILEGPDILPGVAYGPDLIFTHRFPHAGYYKCWLEVLYRGQVVTVSYVVKVE